MKKAARAAALAAAAYLGLPAGLEPAREGGHHHPPRGDPAAAVYIARPPPRLVRALTAPSMPPTVLDNPRPPTTILDRL